MTYFKNLIRLLVILFLSCVCVLAAVPFWPPSLWWLGNLLQIVPLWFLVFPAVGLLFFAACLRDKISILLSLVGLIIFLFGVLDYQIPQPTLITPSRLSDSFSVKILDMNLGRKIDPQVLRDYFQEIQPDIILFQEANDSEMDQVLQILPQGSWSRSLKGHLGIISRFKIQSEEVSNRRPWGGWGGFVGKYELVGPRGNFYVFNVHLETPRDGLEAIMTKRLAGISRMKETTELQATESLVASRDILKDAPLLVGGDFNMSGKNPIFVKYWSGLTDAFAAKGTGFGYTKYTRWHGARIDHILCDSNWRVVRAESGPFIGSDHRPVFAQLMFAPER